METEMFSETDFRFCKAAWLL